MGRGGASLGGGRHGFGLRNKEGSEMARYPVSAATPKGVHDTIVRVLRATTLNTSASRTMPPDHVQRRE
jgi:hypothetical protein